MVPEISDVQFPNGNSAQVLSLSDQTTSLEALDCMGLPMAQPTLVIIGGASLMSAESIERLQTVFDQVFAPLAQSLGLTVLDGGTDTGVIHMMGQARHAIGGNFPLIGVVPQGKARLPSDRHDDSRHDLEPNHTNFFLIPGDEWGSESPWLAELASQISVDRPALTILVNGGQIALIDLKENLATGRPAIVLSGSGRLADSIAAATTAPPPETDPAILELIQHYQPNGKLEVIDLSMPVDQMRDRLQQYFSSTLV
ncbi:MAG TPA: hypothetical protein VEZ50_12160 [Nodosilinea sp.]|nr:hypothetical protein [Nodosilinea sp.]